ncbi:Carboxypeptidase regulatory-like domain-containing protein [Algoriphagus faecimaris]|uniref:Carboxypeptidase regulatory-like domain-containing protein n=1 Tax=Algoriphagus faecimaris TaxID=686796 RepID=A0A1G6TGZ4_9BACT|nr:DUF4382 domain-containing protein [Algoriphagus faecimaris]SDD27776.1 Carboxypeptidase regulatory-like domain-containing protein [Algoriphagus faecimaris]
MKKYISYFMFALVGIFTLGCDLNDSPEMEEGQAQVNFYLVDAPGDFEEVWVEVLALRVKAGGDELAGDDDDDSTWEEIPYEEGSKMVNLMDLTGNNSQLLGNSSFESGRIHQIRLILGDNNFVISEGQKIAMQTPSAQQSGLKLKVDEVIEPNQSYNLIIDFDVAKSIVVAGNSGNIILKPVLRAYMEEAAGIMGQVLPTEAGPVTVEAERNGEVFSTFTDVNGNFKIQGLEPGTYALLITPNDSFSPIAREGVLVEDGKMTVVDPITLEEKE